MFAKKKWSLKAIKWWGGWTDTERTGTIMRYLLDEFSQYENGYGDMLAPDRDDSRHTKFMGDEGSGNLVVTPKSLRIELQLIQENLKEDLDRKFASMRTDIYTEGQLMLKKVTKMFTNLFYGSLSSTNTSASGRLPVPRPAVHGQGDTHLSEPLSALLAPIATPASSEIVGDPPVAPRIPDVSTWHECATQWRDGDPSKGLLVPLSEWNAAMRKSAPSKYSQRKVIGQEYERLHFSKTSMVAEYGERTLYSVRKLVTSIRAKRKQREAKEKENKEREEKGKENEVSDMMATHDLGLVVQDPIVQDRVVRMAVAQAGESEEEEPLIRRPVKDKQAAAVVQMKEREKSKESEEAKEKEANEREVKETGKVKGKGMEKKEEGEREETQGGACARVRGQAAAAPPLQPSGQLRRSSRSRRSKA